ncbi:MAG: hypothetical protein BGO05_12450 [Rhizobiales bacterium 63-7]|nr:hypothetical protein [Hyphomicrobiales bacterium]OJU68683.1 MAG: hypothetical protein BGO05_12450 [Rhizobiales bacterium 63-7]
MIALRATSFLILGLAFGACSALEAPNAAWAGDTDEKLTRAEDETSPLRKQSIREFPKPFHGRWAHVAADCRATGFSAILASTILSIDARGLRQGEWRLAVTSILRSRENPRQISVNAHNTDRGKEWDSLEEFTLPDDGKILEWRRVEVEPIPVTRLYRCA